MLLQRTVGKATVIDGAVQTGRIVCVQNSFSVLGIPSDADPRGMILGGESGVCA